MKKPAIVLAAIATAWAGSATADSVAARCDIYPAGEDHASAMHKCHFSQRQGSVTILREDGVTYDLRPQGDAPGNYRDQNGRAVYRQSGLGDQGLIFRLPDESVYVYWDTSALEPVDDPDNPTAPFTTRDYDATTLLPCRAAGATTFGRCAAGVSRMEDGQASVTVASPSGKQFTINFMSDYINATNREVEARREGDTWVVTTGEGEVYQVPLAAIEGG